MSVAPPPARRWLRPHVLAVALGHALLATSPVHAEQATAGAEQTPQALDAVQVRERRLQKIGLQAGGDEELVQRRGASHVSDLLDQVSGVSMNSMYARPEISVGVQGLAGFGRVSQSLEGITQNFHAFTQDIGQTGSIFIEPQFLKSIDITRGVSTNSSALGSLGGGADFRYLDVDDIVEAGRQFGGMVRGQSGFSGYGNGQKPSGALFLAGRSEHWEAMLAASMAKNGAYRVGSHFDNADMGREFNATNLQYYNANGIGSVSSYENCRYIGVTGITNGYQDGLNNCMLSPEKLARFKQATASHALAGTDRKTGSQLGRLRYFFNDEHEQQLELFASASHASYESDQKPTVTQPAEGDEGTGQWGRQPWSVNTTLDNKVASLKYSGHFSSWLNPEVTAYHEQQVRKQRWLGIPGSYAVNEPLHFFVDQKSNGLKLANASHLQLPVLGPVRLDASLDLRRGHKDVDSLSEEDALKAQREKAGIEYTAQEWDANARTHTEGLALNLSTENDGPWQGSIGVGWQRASVDVLSPRFLTGNTAKEGSYLGATYLRTLYRSQGYTAAQARAMAAAQSLINGLEFKIDPDSGTTRFATDDRHHRFNLRSGQLALQYAPQDSGWSAYASIGYSERAPTSSEMYTSGAWMRQLFVGNPDLKPEQNVSLQLGGAYQGSNLFAEGDAVQASLGFYRNRIENFIGYGPIWMADVALTNGGEASAGAGVGSVNNTAPVVRQGFELNLGYRHPSFLLRLSATLPLRHDNKMCSWTSPSERTYYETFDADYNLVYTLAGKGVHQCYSGWSWVTTSAIEPRRASLTAAWTPWDSRLELGSTVHYRGHQRAAYWYVDDAQRGWRENSQAPLPDGDGWLTAYLWPKTIKVDMYANYRFSPALKMGVYLANLTDQFDGTSTSLGYNFYPGRTLTANLEYRF